MTARPAAAAIGPRAKLFLSSAECEGVFGGGKALLLETIEETGSLQEAARRLGRSYRKAWGDIKRAEEGLGRPLVEKTRGGRDGGTTRLTLYARELLEAWERYRAEVLGQVDRLYDRHLRRLIDQADTTERSSR